MRKSSWVGLGLIVAGVAVLRAGKAARRHGGRSGEPRTDTAHMDDAEAWTDTSGTPYGVAQEMDAAPALVILGALDVVDVVRSDEPKIAVRFAGYGVQLPMRRNDAGEAMLTLGPRQRVEVRVPRGTAVRLRLAKSRSTVTGVDDVHVQCAKGRVVLRDVAGEVRVRSAKSSVEVSLADDRETRSVDVEAAKGRIAVLLPSGRSAACDIQTVTSQVSAPASVEGGIPVRVRAASALIAIAAA